jgi:hypothetical protein
MDGKGDMTYSAQSNINFIINSTSNDPSSPVFTITGDQVKVRGDLVITGSINTTDVFNTVVIQESLKVADNLIYLSSVGSNFDLNDGPFDGENTNDHSGIQVDGIPFSASNLDLNIQAAYEKSFKWNYNQTGVEQIGTAEGLMNESFWELMGGGLRMTAKRVVGDNIEEISFGFRIGVEDDLELIKKYYDSNVSSYVTKRVARFGRILN